MDVLTQESEGVVQAGAGAVGIDRKERLGKISMRAS